MTVIAGALRAAGRQRGSLALVALGLAIGLGAVVLIAPARARMAALEARRAQLERDADQARLAGSDAARARLATETRRLEEIGQGLPLERETPAVYRRLHEAAGSTGLAVVLFQPREPRARDGYVEIPISVAAEGTYHQLAAFLARVAESPRVVTADALKLTALARAAASLRTEMTLTIYVHRPAAAPASMPAGAKSAGPPPGLSTAQPRPAVPPAFAGAGAAGGATVTETAYSPRGQRDPFDPPSMPAVGSATGPRRGSALATATLTGIVNGPDGPLALVELPDGSGYILRAGDGLDDARLVRIASGSVTFDLPARDGFGAERVVLALGVAR